jgi:undecaprenyl-phosphate 4-deoxy-4-formamido-L-arabinose transferase
LEAEASEFEIIFVNDGSRDASWTILQELASRDPHLRAIGLLRNYGQHNALLAGIRAAQYDVLLTIDDDLQHPPEEIPKLLQKLSEGHDVVYGTPSAEDHGVWRNLASRVTKLALQSTMGVDTAGKVSAFRVFRAQIREAFAAFQGPYVCIDVLLTWGTTRFAAISVAHAPRKHGVSNYSFRMLCTHALNMVTGFSVLPLRIASFLGFLATFVGILLFIYVLGRSAVSGGVVPGFSFLASAVTLFSGVQLFTLGVVGEYLARMHFRLMDRPAYAVREHLSIASGTTAERQRQPHG